jgi:hypothetical protein
MTLINVNDTSILITGIVVALVFLLLERFVFRRGHVNLTKHSLAYPPTKKGESITVVLDYDSKSKILPYSKVRGRLVDKAAPTTVIELKPRSLAMSPQKTDKRVKHCQEFLHFPVKPFLLSGDEDWELHLEVITIGCYVNPFYKIFPVIARLRGDIFIKQPKR